MKDILAIAVVLLFSPHSGKGQDFARIVSQNTQAIVYLQVEDAKGGVLNRGTGFIVSPDGYLLTADHLKVMPTQRMRGVVGKRDGNEVDLSFEGSDNEYDVALWGLPKSAGFLRGCNCALCFRGIRGGRARR